MRFIKIFLVILLFSIFSLPHLAAGQNEDKVASFPETTKKEFMQTAIMPSITKAPHGIPTISAFADWDYYYLHKPISWTPEAKHKNKYKAVGVPIGFVTDLASIPKVFWQILPRQERYTHPAIIHDYLYWTQRLPRKVADQILKIGMEEFHVENWKVEVIYNAVRVLGGSAWEENAKLKTQGEKRFLKKYPSDPKITWAEWKKHESVLANEGEAVHYISPSSEFRLKDLEERFGEGRE